MSSDAGVAVTPRLLEAVFASGPDHVYLFDSGKRYRFVSEWSLVTLGVPRERVIGKTWQEAGLDPVAMSAFEGDLDIVLLTGDPRSARVEYPTTFGSRTYDYSIQPTVDESGERGALVTVHDRTPIVGVDAERNLAELESIYAYAPVGLAVLDAELRFVRVNERLAQMNGFTPQEHLGRSAWDLVPELREAAEPHFLRVLETGEGMFNVEITGVTPAQPEVERT